MEICLTMSRGKACVNYTVGFGNNLFQYTYGRLLAEKNDFDFHAPGITELNIPATSNTKILLGPYGERMALPQEHLSGPQHIISDAAAHEALTRSLERATYTVRGYFEDYELYAPYVEKIRSWFPPVEKNNTTDLVLHLRLQNRLVQKNHHRNHISAEGYLRGIEKFDFDRLHIITDSKKWDFYDIDDIKEIQEKVRNGPGTHAEWVTTERSINYMNSLVEKLAVHDPIVHCATSGTMPKSGALAANFIDDFNFIRSFDKIMLFNSTFSWWAALLSEATCVGTYGPWKATKKKKKNLGQTNFPGWFSWGDENDLYWSE